VGGWKYPTKSHYLFHLDFFFCLGLCDSSLTVISIHSDANHDKNDTYNIHGREQNKTFLLLPSSIPKKWARVRTSNAGPSLITVQCELTRLSWVKIDIYLISVFTVLQKYFLFIRIFSLYKSTFLLEPSTTHLSRNFWEFESFNFISTETVRGVPNQTRGEYHFSDSISEQIHFLKPFEPI